MTIKEVSALDLAGFLKGGAAFLGVNKDEVNALNVFPVPDGDTGINMYLTIKSAAKNIEGRDYQEVSQLAQDFSMGALMGARGNSGVILSQIFRGFSQGVAGKISLDAKSLAYALQKGVDLSYKSVMKPVEGTILTVFKDFAAAATRYAFDNEDIAGMIAYALEEGKKSLANTPNLLPVLKQAGVVDAGGKGLLVIMEGGYLSLIGQSVVDIEKTAQEMQEVAAVQELGDIEFGYCTELLIKGDNIPLDEIRFHFAQTPPGDSLLVVGTDNVVKVHFHTNSPWEVLEYAASFGSIHDIKIENMRDQHQELQALTMAEEEASEDVNCSVLAVCAGEGLTQIFINMGASVISGGQTMNPSAEDILNAIKASPGKEAIVLPNNSNIILTAQQAQKLSDKKILVIPTKFITQGLAAMLHYDRENSADANMEMMSEAAQDAISGELTYAVRDSSYDGMDIKAHDILALAEGQIVAVGQDMKETLMELLEKMIAMSSDPCIISLFYGHDLQEADAEEILAKVQEKYSNMDVELHYGGQPLYYFLLSVE